MIIESKVITWSKKTYIEYLWKDENRQYYKVKLNAKPVDWQANKQLIKVFSEYFSVSKSEISIIKWEKSKNKILEISF